MSDESLLEYYRENAFNPTQIDLEDNAGWELHFARRLNLYQRHLGIPLTLLRDSSLLEFGCNSGENSLVLASAGANLTLVEPNGGVLPRLRELFKKFDLEKRIVRLAEKDIASFTSPSLYDIVVAEGFLYTLPNRDEMFRKIAGFLAPGGLAVISFNDRYGGLLEFTRRMLLWRVCQLAGVKDIHSKASLKLAGELYRKDFSRLNTSRPFEVWWKDGLVNPFSSSRFLWSWPELLSLIEKESCEFYSSSPRWTSTEQFRWYKDTLDRKTINKQLLDNWLEAFSFFLTGLPASGGKGVPADSEVIDSVSRLIKEISEYTQSLSNPIGLISYPSALEDYFRRYGDPKLLRLNSEMKRLYDVAMLSKMGDLIAAYHQAECLRSLWGVPYQYICFSKVDQERLKIKD